MLVPRTARFVLLLAGCSLPLAALFSIAACRDDESTAPTATSTVCEAGLRLEPGRAGDNSCASEAGASTAEPSPTQSCRTPRTIGRLELSKGLNVEEFLLTLEAPDGSTGVIVEWSAPGAKTVECAVFRCLPEVAKSTDDDHGVSISTFNRCVIASGYFAAQRGNTDLASLQPNATLDPPNTAFALQELSVGCWAYDDIEVTGASRLVQIPVDRVEAVIGPDVFTTTCADDTEGRACPLGEGLPFGICQGRICRVRCNSVDDCVATASQAKRGADAAKPECTDFDCTTPAGSPFGLCIRR